MFAFFPVCGSLMEDWEPPCRANRVAVQLGALSH
jgi:hypothetical protein